MRTMKNDETKEAPAPKSPPPRRSKGGKFAKTITAEKRTTTLMLRRTVLEHLQNLASDCGTSLSEQIDVILGDAVGIGIECPPAHNAVKQLHVARRPLKYHARVRR